VSILCDICEIDKATERCSCGAVVCDDDAADCENCGEIMCRDCGEWRVTNRGDVLRESPDDEQWFCFRCLS